VLGHVVSCKGISPYPDKIAAVQNFPQPRTVNEVQSFLGLCSYSRRFIQNFLKRVCHMKNLVQKHVAFEWTPAHSQEFLDLKDCCHILRCSRIIILTRSQFYTLMRPPSVLGLCCLNVMATSKNLLPMLVVCYRLRKK